MQKINPQIDPRCVDSDQDGLTDWEENFIYHTDPKNPDTDNDGIIDSEGIFLKKNSSEPTFLYDLLIPHEGNLYQPHILHPKRIVFHAITAIIIKIIIIFYIISFPIEAWLTPEFSFAQSQKIISLTNDLREHKNLVPLLENPILTKAAIAKTQDMLIAQYFDHFSPTKQSLADWLNKFSYNYIIAGENLAMGFVDAAAVVNGWINSKTHYANLIDPDFKEIGVGVTTGNFKGEETTLVAQFFGTKKKTEQPKTNNTIPSTTKLAILTTPKNNIPSHTTTTTPTTTMQLVAPKIIFPENGYLTKEKNITIKIFAPQSEKIALTINDKKIILANFIVNGKNDGYYNYETELIRGLNYLSVKSIRGRESADSEKIQYTLDNSIPLADSNKSQVSIAQITEDKKIIRAVAYLSPDTKKAELNFDQTNIPLTKEDNNRWTGSAMLFTDQSPNNNPIILPNIYIEDYAGNNAKTDIRIDNVKPIKISALDQYSFVKNHQSLIVKSIFDLGSYYYKLLLILVTISLLINIFIKIKKQHAHVIASALSLMILLIALIIF